MFKWSTLKLKPTGQTCIQECAQKFRISPPLTDNNRKHSHCVYVLSLGTKQTTKEAAEHTTPLVIYSEFKEINSKRLRTLPLFFFCCPQSAADDSLTSLLMLVSMETCSALSQSSSRPLEGLFTCQSPRQGALPNTTVTLQLLCYSYRSAEHLKPLPVS